MDCDKDNIIELFDCVNFSEYNRKLPSSESKLTIIHVNIRSMIKNFWRVEQILSEANSVIDVLIITEANISENLKSLYNINYYTMYTVLRKNQKGGGIILYIKNKYTFTHINFKTLHFECLLGTINITSVPLTLCAVYRPPNTNKRQFVFELDTLLEKHHDTDFIFLGDVNIDLKLENSVKNHTWML